MLLGGSLLQPNKAINDTMAEAKQIPIVCPGHTRPLAELQFQTADNRTFLLSACHDKLPMLRDGTTGDWIGSFQGHKGAVWSCKLDQTGCLCATASGDFSVRIWDGITGKSIWEFPHQHIVKSCDFSDNSKYLATGGHEGKLRIFDLERVESGGSKEPTATIPMTNDPKPPVITKICWFNNTTVICGCSDGDIRIIDTETSKLIHTIDTGKDEIRDLELCQTILTVAAGKTVFFYETANQYQLIKQYDMPVHFREEGGASLHPNQTKFIAGGSDLWVRVYDYATGKELECLKGHHGPIRCLRYSPTGKLFATGSEDGTIRLWTDKS